VKRGGRRRSEEIIDKSEGRMVKIFNLGGVT
jgi:hypothetical protein